MAQPPEQIDPDSLRETIDVLAIQRLHAAYADAVTCRDWPRLAELFVDEATVVVDTVTSPARQFVGGREIASFIA
ncbi:MAG TPA: nuclear transport factor 2 family protein, partial [Microthrixaceae bacterium]|nr:nuclear transport factor 2 family protein [Microthrixaceae bacterium]